MAVVFSVDRVLDVMAARGLAEIKSLLARYVAENAASKLWESDAKKVEDLLSSGEIESAVNVYFERVGHRWDTERVFCGRASAA